MTTIVRNKSIKICQWAGLLIIGMSSAEAQPTERWPRQPEIYFPEAPVPGKWRKSIGVVFTTTPPELTEEVRVSVPAIDFNFQRGLTQHMFFAGRFQTQFLQNNLGLGLRWATPLTDRLFWSAGLDLTGWIGGLKIKDVFNSQAYGVEALPNLSVGYRLTRDLRLTVKSEAILDLYYRSQVGSLAVVRNSREVNGVAFTFMLEQPFYHQTACFGRV